MYWDTNHQTQAPSISDFENEIETASSTWISDDKILSGGLVDGTADGVHGIVGGTAIDGVSHLADGGRPTLQGSVALDRSTL